MDSLGIVKSALDAYFQSRMGTKHRTAPVQASDMQAMGQISVILSYPVLYAQSIQDLDPDSPTFGQFWWKLDDGVLGP